MGLRGGLDLESYRCFLRLRFVGLFMSFLNISFIGMGAFNLKKAIENGISHLRREERKDFGFLIYFRISWDKGLQVILFSCYRVGGGGLEAVLCLFQIFSVEKDSEDADCVK